MFFALCLLLIIVFYLLKTHEDNRIISYVIIGLISPLLFLLEEKVIFFNSIEILNTSFTSKILIVSFLMLNSIIFLFLMIKNQKEKIAISWNELFFLLFVSVNNIYIQLSIIVVATSIKYLDLKEEKINLKLLPYFLIVYLIIYGSAELGFYIVLLSIALILYNITEQKNKGEWLVLMFCLQLAINHLRGETASIITLSVAFVMFFLVKFRLVIKNLLKNESELVKLINNKKLNRSDIWINIKMRERFRFDYQQRLDFGKVRNIKIYNDLAFSLVLVLLIMAWEVGILWKALF